MHELAVLQRQMKEALVVGGAPVAALEQAVVSDAVPAARRIRVHQNNYRETLSSALLSLFPVAAVFVGEQFMKAVVTKYIAKEPPREAVLGHYGEGLAAFLAGFPPARQVPYLADVIKLEWAIHSLQLVREVDISTGGANEGVLRVSPNTRLVDSAYPILNLWMAGTGQIPPEAVQMNSDGQCAAVMLTNGEVRLMALDRAQREVVKHVEAGRDAEGGAVAALLDMTILYWAQSGKDS